jgi:hypothetical protein
MVFSIKTNALGTEGITSQDTLNQHGIDRQMHKPNTKQELQRIDDAGHDASSAQVSEYVADMCLELRNICNNSRQPYLAYLLEIVFKEATEIATKARVRQAASQQQ